MKIFSFNVNGVRARMDILVEFLEKEQPDIIGFQETKVRDEEFPEEVFADLGYEVNYFGQKSFNGVAILSKKQPIKIVKGFKTDTEESQKRLIMGTFQSKAGEEFLVINGYFPMGENKNHETKFPAKIAFYQNLMKFLATRSPEENILVMGDFNIAPEDSDVGIKPVNAKRWLKTGKCAFLPEEREMINTFKDWGFFDTFRELNPNVADLFSWFDYRSRGFDNDPKIGLRIDQIWVTKSMLELCKNTGIDYEYRAKERPSDHCAIWAEFDL